MDLDLHLDLDLELGWIWGDSGMDLGSGSESGPDPALIRHFPASRLKSRRSATDGWRAGPPTGHILDPFLTTIRTL